MMTACSNSCCKKKNFILLIINKSNKIRIIFLKYWMYWYIWVSLESEFVFFTTKSSKTGHKSDNFSDIKKPVRILLDNPTLKNQWAKYLEVASYILLSLYSFSHWLLYEPDGEVVRWCQSCCILTVKRRLHV